jgi:hypothetical protein
MVLCYRLGANDFFFHISLLSRFMNIDVDQPYKAQILHSMDMLTHAYLVNWRSSDMSRHIYGLWCVLATLIRHRE